MHTGVAVRVVELAVPILVQTPHAEGVRVGHPHVDGGIGVRLPGRTTTGGCRRFRRWWRIIITLLLRLLLAVRDVEIHVCVVIIMTRSSSAFETRLAVCAFCGDTNANGGRGGGRAVG